MSYRGTLLFVSHDRTLLNRLPTIVLHLQGGQLTPYFGQFDTFLELRELTEIQREKALEKIKQRRVEMEKFVERFGAKASKARQAQSRMKMINQLVTLETGLQGNATEQSIKIRIPPPAKSPRIMLQIETAEIGYSRDKPLLSNFQLTIERQDRLGIVGANGLGKSTLLRTIAGIIPPLSGQRMCASEVKIGYFSQDQMDLLNPTDSVISNFCRLTDLDEAKSRDLLGGFLFSGTAVSKAVNVLSGGEKSRLVLASVIGSGANLLILDEPTNHLDMASVEALELALEDYEGTIICVSHDREFLERICSQMLVLATGRKYARFLGDLSDYQIQAAATGFPDIFAEVPTQSTQDAGQNNGEGSQEARRLEQK
ncbi:MAG: ABC-F family ATP-binding cassette domain-containing protein, partial [Pseudomonadota bacterium]